ncbi:M15 family metallopeptidase [Cellulomonas sp. KRMCY2]|uniref:M15 family metallopeptidase n=1 Tax=Cellulomonas sp. KRMCY2 TaxID=1304865 RepID=UPI0004B337EE|nr:M15 family metallopeptidase [Cellulomonas sp. KRMCY2]
MGAILGRLALQLAAQALQTKKGRAVIAGAAALVLLLPLALILGVATISTAAAQDASTLAIQEEEAITGRCFADPVATEQDATLWADLTVAQQEAATTIVGVVRSATVVPGGADDLTARQAAVVAIAASMQESRLTNLGGGDQDSLGLFQQRPSMGWGTTEQLGDPIYATTAFLYGATTNPGLVDVPGWPTLSLTIAAQAVQRSGYPAAYAQWQGFAQDVVDELWATTPLAGVHPALDRPDLGDATTAILRPVTLEIRGGDAGCELVGVDAPTTTWDGVYRKPVEWGGYANGHIPPAAMCIIPWAPTHLARCDAVTALTQLNELYKADHGGQPLGISSSYRNFDRQVELKRQLGYLAAEAGKSNHGLGMALDLIGFGGVGDYTKPNYLWMMANAPAFGWVSPPWTLPGVQGPDEPWHWEFMGSPEPPPVVAPTP